MGIFAGPVGCTLVQPVLLQLFGIFIGEPLCLRLVDRRGGGEFVVLDIQQQELRISIILVVRPSLDNIFQCSYRCVVCLGAVGVFGEGKHTVAFPFLLAVYRFGQHQSIIVIFI